MNTPSDTWNNDQTYLKGLQISKHIKVCNDLTKKAIKMTQDYCYHTKSEDGVQDIVQIVVKNLRSFMTINTLIFLFNNA